MSGASACAGVPRASEKAGEAKTETAGSDHTRDYAAEADNTSGKWNHAENGAMRQRLF